MKNRITTAATATALTATASRCRGANPAVTPRKIETTLIGSITTQRRMN